MRPDEVTKVGDSLERLAEGAKEHTAWLLDSSDTVACEHGSWRSATTLSHCQYALQGQLNQLVDRTRWIGQDVAAAAKGVSELDLAASARIRRVLSSMSGG
jgi:hypothetical protein